MEWISVEDRLPDNMDTVLIYLGDDDWDTGWYNHCYQAWIDHRDEVCYPTHWALVTKPNNDCVVTINASPEQPAPPWQLYEEVAKTSTDIQDDVRALIIDLAELGEGSQTFGDAISALKHLEVVTEYLTTASEDLKPEPSLNEVLANINKRMGASVKKTDG